MKKSRLLCDDREKDLDAFTLMLLDVTFPFKTIQKHFHSIDIHPIDLKRILIPELQ